MWICGWIGREDGGKIDGAGETDETGEMEWVVLVDESRGYDGAGFGGGEKSETGAKGDEKLWLFERGPKRPGMFTKTETSTSA